MPEKGAFALAFGLFCIERTEFNQRKLTSHKMLPEGLSNEYSQVPSNLSYE